MDHPKTTTCLEWCAGYGGIHLGLKRAIPNLRVIAYGEIEAFACANLVAKMEAGLLDPAPIWTDLKTFPCEEFRDRVGLLVAGYPCQPFSAAGKRLGADDPRHLWPHILRAIGIIRPRMCFFENVEGHISLGLREVLGDLGAAGYTAAWGIFSASEVGAPHQRKRVFILAYRECEGLERFYNWNTSAEQAEHVGADAWASRECGAWPSRPGEQQFAWEPPRVVGAVPAKLANFCSRDSQQGRDTAQAGGESVSAWRESEDAMPHSRSSICGGDQGDQQALANDHRAHARHGEQRPERTLGDLSGGCGEGGGTEGLAHTGSLGRRGRSDGDAGGLRGEIQTAGSCGGGAETMGNAASSRCKHPQDTGANRGDESQWPRGEESERAGLLGNPYSPRPQERPRQRGSAIQGADADGGEAAERQTQPPLGGDADGTAGGLGYAELRVSCDNRTDELRLLGNGVVPATAERAFLTLMEELLTTPPKQT